MVQIICQNKTTNTMAHITSTYPKYKIILSKRRLQHQLHLMVLLGVGRKNKVPNKLPTTVTPNS